MLQDKRMSQQSIIERVYNDETKREMKTPSCYGEDIKTI